ncbi:hypothetical protein [uncultured Acetatifactor sp.]|jgi:hypothetical protein|uniref:hypothetical protein n=1 Tax=uncultured Acetatifactor sp. TaxID=1671927 RepID=UPI002629A243|nr:hypothetical protein [uncultured Acetatifactor sp.]
MDTKENYQYLIEEYSKEIICRRYKFWYEQMLIFIKSAGLENNIRIDRRKLGYAILSYFADIFRLKEFHKLDRTNLPKVYAYEAYWILRMSPLQLVNGVSDELLWINEKFITTILISDIVTRIDKENIDFEKYPVLKELAELIVYNFKYRVYTAQSLEMMLKAVSVGIALGR